ncbi:MAG: enoyl-CoA hydratase/isomerase family protein [Betaproteobacteria bacterium]|nr:MAG: enoyl-CoA hydratase/isomerase family protein [Betaproteobacteria bacterium]
MSAINLEKRGDRVALLTLNRPQAMNAIDRAMARALRAAIADVEADESIDVLVLTGAGERGFCAGVDLKERTRLTDAEAAAYRAEELFPMYRELDARSKPALAAVFGHTLAGGFELALACDLIVAAEDASFGLPEVKWGLIPAAGGCRKLPALIGAARAKELILTAKTISAEEALRLGMINRVVKKDELLPAARELARQILQNNQPAVRGAKRCIDEAVDARAACAFDLEVANRCYTTRDLTPWKERGS